MTIRIESSAGSYINNVCLKAAILAAFVSEIAAGPWLEGRHMLVRYDSKKSRPQRRVFRTLWTWNPDTRIGQNEDGVSFKSSDLEGSSLGSGYKFWSFIRENGYPNKLPDGMHDIDFKIDGYDNLDIEFEFNETTVVCPVSRGTKEADIEIVAEELRIQWNEKIKAASEAYWTPERLAEKERRRLAAQKKDRLRKDLRVKAIELFPFSPVTGKEEEWELAKSKNSDPYGGAAYSYAQGWASLMEYRMSQGATLVECAKEASQDADVEGITGFMYGCAVSVLSNFWKHGEELRRWHNKDTQIGDEGDKANESGGVLNPALLSVGSPN